MATPNQSLNQLLKFYDMLLSGDLGLFTGTADPLALAEEQMAEDVGTPLAETYLRSSNEDVKRVFSGLVSGQLDPISAKNELTAAFGAAVDTAPLYKAVDDVVKEMATSRKSKKPTSPAAKGYLPSPLESYADPMYQQNPELIPLLPKAQQAVGQLDQRLSLLKQIAPKARGTVSGQAKQRTDFSSIDPKLGAKFNAMSPRAQEMVLKQISGAVSQGEKQRGEYIGQNLQNLQAQGRSPFQDALLKRAAALAGMMGQRG